MDVELIPCGEEQGVGGEFQVHRTSKSPLELPGHCPSLYNLPSPSNFHFFSLALFAFWLRSSVVSVLFSLISEILLRKKSMIKFIFDPREESSGLAYGSLHCVPGLTLPPGDANLFFHQCAQLDWVFGEEEEEN